MYTAQARPQFYETEEGKELLKALNEMQASDIYRTESQFCADTIKYPDNKIPFEDFHMSYMQKNPKVDRRGYMSNLRLMLTIR